MRIEKIQLVNDIGTILKDSDYVFLISYKGLNVKDFAELRGNLADANADCHVLKNRLIRKAAEQVGLDDFAKVDLLGDTAVISGKGDAGTIAKVISTFGKKCDSVAPKSGYLDGAVLSGNDVRQIAALPPREVLLAQLLGVLEAPSRNLVGVMYTKATEILNVLNAYKNSKEN
jgi:large subunit ribosomal protein L10